MKWTTILVIFTICNCAQGQGKYDANWCFGIKAGVNFSNVTQPVNFSTVCNDYAADASISDSLGNLLFYIAPDTPFYLQSEYGVLSAIYNSNNEIILNGDSINTGDNLTGALFLPVPQTKDSFYVIYMNRLSTEEATNLYYSLIVKETTGYRVLQKNYLLSTAPIEWRIAAVKHANGTDWWIIVHESDIDSSTNRFYEFLVAKDSISGPFSQNTGSIHSSLYVATGELKFSKNGNWLASTLGDQNGVDLFNIDRCTGQLKNFILIDSIDSLGKDEITDCEFSADGSKLYASEGYSDVGVKSGLYQFDLTSSNINSTKMSLYRADSFQINFGNLLRGPDNKIYLAVEYSGVLPYDVNTFNQFCQYLWVINDPDSADTACNFQPYAYYLGDSARVYWALPNMPNYNLGALSIYKGTGWDTIICKGDSFSIGNPPVDNVTYAWQRANGIINTTLAQQTIKPDTSTWYYLTLTDTTINYSCQSVTDSFFVQVVNCCDLLQLSQCILSTDTSLCAGIDSGVTLVADSVPGISFIWQVATGITNLHATQQTVNPFQSTWYYVNFFSDTNGSLPCNQRTDSVYVQVIVCCDTALLAQCTLSKDTFICTNIDTPTKGASLLAYAPKGILLTWQPGFDIDTNNIHGAVQIVDPTQSTWYYVTFMDTAASGACNSKMDSVFVDVKTCMEGITQPVQSIERLQIFPNPAQNMVTAEWQAMDGQLELTVTDLLSRKIKSFKVDGITGKTEIDISGLANGLYVVRLMSPSGGGVGGGKLAIAR